MRGLLALLAAGILFASAAVAADNFQFTLPGQPTVTIKSTDTGSGVQAINIVDVTSGGAAIVDGARVSGSLVGAGVVVGPVDMTGYKSITLQTTSAGSGNTVTFEVSDEDTSPTAFQPAMCFLVVSTAVQPSAAFFIATRVQAANEIVLCAKTGKWFRARTSTAGSGTVTLVGSRSVTQDPILPQFAFLLSTSATAASVSTHATHIGCQGRTSVIAVTNGQLSSVPCSLEGAVVTRLNSLPELTWSANVSLTDTTSTALAAAAGASLKRYITDITIAPIATTTAVTVTVLDGSTARWSCTILNGGISYCANKSWTTPPQVTANTALNVQLSGAPTGAVIVSASGYTAR